MPSPFPGMDPWLEAPRVYASLRFCFVVRLSDAINAVLPEGYVAKIAHITDDIESVDAESFVSIVAIGAGKREKTALTSIEFPERHRNWRQCRAKGKWKSGRLLVRLFRDPWVDPSQPPLAPQIVTHRYGETEHTELETLDYKNPLPPLRLPFQQGLPDLDVPLQPLLDSIYDRGRYSMQVKYSKPCDPPLTPEQQAWSEAVLREKGLLK